MGRTEMQTLCPSIAASRPSTRLLSPAIRSSAPSSSDFQFVLVACRPPLSSCCYPLASGSLFLVSGGGSSTFASRFLQLGSPPSSPSGAAGLGRKRRKNRFRFSAMAAASGAQDSTPSDVARMVTIVNSAGEKLAGRIDDTKSKDLVVLCHGFRSSKDSNTLDSIAEAILKTGISTFRFDFAGNGESEGQFAYGNYWRETEDLRSVILHWRAEGRHVKAILGHSKGGNVVVLYASKYGDVNTVINVSGRFDLTIGTDARFGKKGMVKLREQGFLDVKDPLTGEVAYRVTTKSLEDRLATDMDAAARSISKDIRVLTIHGEVDEVVAVVDADEFAKRIPNHELRVIVGGNHNYEESKQELSTLVLEFLQGKLSKI